MTWEEIDRLLESNLIENSEIDIIKVSDFKDKSGKYFGACTEDNYDEMEVSPRIKITISYITEKDEIRGIKIQRYKKEGSRWIGDQHINFSNIGREKIYSLVNAILALDMRGVAKKYIPLEAGMETLDEETKNKLRTLLLTPDGKKILAEMAPSEVTDQDIVSIAYRKKQLRIFKALLDNPNLLDDYKKKFKINNAGHEPGWQHFFEKNPWIFGFGLNYIFCDNIDDRKLESIVSGANFNSGGKRADALLKTRGLISSFVLVEIKTPEIDLVENMARSESWSVSKPVIDGIAQSHKTVMKFKKQYYEKTGLKDDEGNPTGEVVYNFNPKSYLVIGNLNQFQTDSGVNEDKYSSFELFRGSCLFPEIITFDELYHRASGIIANTGVLK